MVGWNAGTAALGAAAAIAASPPAVAPRSSTTCDQAVDPDTGMAPNGNDLVVANRIAFYKGDLTPPARSGLLRYWTKIPVLIRPRRTPVDVIVPAAWRSRVAVGWQGSQTATRVRFRGCSPIGQEQWLF